MVILNVNVRILSAFLLCPFFLCCVEFMFLKMNNYNSTISIRMRWMKLVCFCDDELLAECMRNPAKRNFNQTCKLIARWLLSLCVHEMFSKRTNEMALFDSVCTHFAYGSVLVAVVLSLELDLAHTICLPFSLYILLVYSTVLRWLWTCCTSGFFHPLSTWIGRALFFFFWSKTFRSQYSWTLGMSRVCIL